MRSDVVGLDSAIVTNPKVFEQSGHLVNFHDALVECKKCHQRFKADDLGKECTNCGDPKDASEKWEMPSNTQSAATVTDAAAPDAAATRADIIAEVKKQLNSLERQARQARTDDEAVGSCSLGRAEPGVVRKPGRSRGAAPPVCPRRRAR